MTEVEDAVDSALLHVVHHPFEVVQLQVSDAHEADNAFLLQFYESGQRLVAHLLQASGQGCLKLYVVDIDDVYVIDVEPFHALIYAVGHSPCGIIPRVHAVLAVSSHLCAEIVFLPWQHPECLSEHGLCLIVSIVGTYVDKVDAAVESRLHSPDAVRLLCGMKHAAE